MTSAAETVMNQYSSPPPPNHYGPATRASTFTDTKLVVDPHTGYTSPHDRNFRGCLGCGDPNHQYKHCDKNKTEPTHSTFTKNFLARYPDKRRYPPRPEEVTTLVAIPPPAPTAATTPGILRTPSTGGIGRGAGAIIPAWMTRERNEPAPPPHDDSSKRVRLFTILVKILQKSAPPSSRIQPFPIRIDNNMPAITFMLGTSPQ
jgi:hypothetical protein